MSDQSEVERAREEFWQHIAASYGGTNWERIAAQMLDALLAAVRAEERETLATGLDTRAEALAHGHGVAGNIDGMSDEEFERRMKAAGKGCTVCARIELLSECAAALRASQEGENG